MVLWSASNKAAGFLQTMVTTISSENGFFSHATSTASNHALSLNVRVEPTCRPKDNLTLQMLLLHRSNAGHFSAWDCPESRVCQCRSWPSFNRRSGGRRVGEECRSRG